MPWNIRPDTIKAPLDVVIADKENSKQKREQEQKRERPRIYAPQPENK